jgi:uncharacterized protein YjbJ (UPF0337 family)
VNKDQVVGKVKQAVGKVKQTIGETLGNEKLANQGVVDQAKGAAKETWGNAKDAEQDQSVGAKRQGESQREDRRIQGAPFSLTSGGFDQVKRRLRSQRPVRW